MAGKQYKPLILAVFAILLCVRSFGQENAKSDWVVFMRQLKNKPTRVETDLAWQAKAPIKEQPYLITIIIDLKHPDTDGMASASEQMTLKELRDVLISRTKANAYSFLGSFTGNAVQLLYFQSDDSAGWQPLVQQVFDTRYKTRVITFEDPAWQFYFGFLCPNEQEYQSAQNRKVIDQLREAGDPLTKPRPVFHWIYFKTENDSKVFLEKIQDEGFKIEEKGISESDKEYPYRLRLSRTDKVDLKSADSYVLKLWQTAKDAGGDYDGWETSVESAQ